LLTHLLARDPVGHRVAHDAKRGQQRRVAPNGYVAAGPFEPAAYSPGVELIRRPYGHPDVVALTDEVQAHYRQLYGGPGDESIVEVADFEEPTGHFVVGYVDGVPVAMGGWRRLGERPGLPSPNAAEIKRMYVSPSARGRGLSRIVLAELEATARAAGLDWLVLETGRPQTSALGLYRSSGYCEVDGTAYGHYVGEPDVIHLGRSLG
jgi:ribosomal protein S18 acetylase RimI-like enzyme